jgi:hypothetical protein
MPRIKKITAAQREYIVNHSNENVDKLVNDTGLSLGQVTEILGTLPKKEEEKPKKVSNLQHTSFDKEALSKGAVVMTGAQASLNNPDQPFRQNLRNEDWYKNVDFIAPIVVKKPE